MNLTSQDNQNIILALYKIGAIKLGNFTLKSGIQSPIYIDLRQIISYPDILRVISHRIWDLVRMARFDLICGVPYTALPIATCLSLEHNIPMIMRRKEKKSYGTQQQIEGAFTHGQSCLLVEDIITSGSSLIETATDLEDAGLKIKDVVVLIDREQGGKENLQARDYTVHTAFSLAEILQNLLSSGITTEPEREIIHNLITN